MAPATSCQRIFKFFSGEEGYFDILKQQPPPTRGKIFREEVERGRGEASYPRLDEAWINFGDEEKYLSCQSRWHHLSLSVSLFLRYSGETACLQKIIL